MIRDLPAGFGVHVETWSLEALGWVWVGKAGFAFFIVVTAVLPLATADQVNKRSRSHSDPATKGCDLNHGLYPNAWQRKFTLWASKTIGGRPRPRNLL